MGPRDLVVVVTGVFALTMVAAPPAAGQQGEVPRTSWGAPDLQGLWTSATLTPLERPRELANKEFLTKEEAAALEAKAAAEQFTERAPRAGDPGTYNQIWFDSGTAVVPSRRTSLITDPPDGRIPYTADARKHERPYGEGPYDSHLDLDTGERCLGDGLPMIWLGYNPNHQIVQTQDYVVILHEMFRERRIIPLAKTPHANIPQWNGDIRGWWEGDTLVVESTSFVDRPGFRWAATWRAPASTMRLIERFTRVGAQTLDYKATIDDPARFSRPWTVELPLTSDQAARGVTAGRLFEYACHEGNYSLVHVLSGARTDERKGAATKTPPSTR
jgi:hypothetical protein